MATANVAMPTDPAQPDRGKPRDLTATPRRVLRRRAEGHPQRRGNHPLLHHLPRGGLPPPSSGRLTTPPILPSSHRSDLRDHPTRHSRPPVRPTHRTPTPAHLHSTRPLHRRTTSNHARPGHERAGARPNTCGLLSCSWLTAWSALARHTPPREGWSYPLRDEGAP